MANQIRKVIVMFVALAILVSASLATTYAYEGAGSTAHRTSGIGTTPEDPNQSVSEVELSNFTAQTDEKGIVSQ